ncbi:MAG: MOSC domain-containing protein [Gemmataceae bacterium]
MHIHSVNLSPPTVVSYRGKDVLTGIFKTTSNEPIHVRRLGLEGDTIADLRYHGGLHKAVYSYPWEHYPFWESERGRALMPGTFGENLTTVGLDESTVQVGDRFQVGSVVLEAAQPRKPCFKLGIKMDDPRFIKIYLNSGKTGIYWRVVEEGVLKAGDPMVLIQPSLSGITIWDVWNMVHNDQFDEEKAKRLIRQYIVGPEWREPLEERLS